MPRIAASLAVLLTAVTCIGFNTARYPAVWQMVAASGGAAQSDRSDGPAAAPQSESLAQPEAEVESAPSWQSDWQSDDDRTDSTDWESTTAEASSAYAGYEEKDSYGDSGAKSSCDSNQGSYRYSDETAYESEGGWYDTPTASSPGYGQNELAGSDDDHPDAGDDYEPAGDGGYNSCGSDENEPVDRLAMRASAEQTTREPETAVAQSGFDPVAPQHRSATSGTSYDGYGEEASGSDRADASGNEASASEDAVIGPTEEPVKVPASARYASYPFGAYGEAPDRSPACSGDALAQHDTDERGELVPQSTLVPVKPATTESNGGESLARRPWADLLSVPDRVGSSGTSEVVPLPPLDEVSTVAAPEAGPGVGEDAIPIYPTTVVE